MFQVLVHHPGRYVRQSAIALLDDKDLGALKAMTPHKKGHLTKARMKPIMDSSLDVLIPGSMSLLRPGPARRISPLPSPELHPRWPAWPLLQYGRSRQSPRGRSTRRAAGRIADYLTRKDFTILDELGYLPFAQAGGQLLFHSLASSTNAPRRSSPPIWPSANGRASLVTPR